MHNTFRALIDQCATELPDNQVIYDPDAQLSMTYGQLRTLCRKFAHHLSSISNEQDAHIGFMLDNSYWTFLIFMGTMYSGRTVVPLNVVASHQNLQFALTNAKVSVVFVSERYRPLLDDLLSDMDHKLRIEMVDMDTGFNMQTADKVKAEFALLPVNPDSPAMILHTSGTVGLPKGAVLTHKNLITGGKNVTLGHQLVQQDVAYCVLPLYHVNGQVVTCVAPLISRSKVVMPHRFSVHRFWEHIQDCGCTWTSIVPTIAKYLLDEYDHACQKGMNVDIPQLRFARSASSAMPAGMHHDFEEKFDTPMIETLGLTETAGTIIANPMPPAMRKPGSVGIPFGTEAKIIGDDGCELPNNSVGEIIVKGDNNISEYYNAPEATALAFTADGWFRTGDLGYQDEDGYFFVSGRSKELIIKGGENISPREIDDVLYHHDKILEAAAFGFPDENYGEVVAVAVVLKTGSQCTVDELVEYCRHSLGDFRVPSRIFFVDELPKGPSGKIQRLEAARSLIAEHHS